MNKNDLEKYVSAAVKLDMNQIVVITVGDKWHEEILNTLTKFDVCRFEVIDVAKMKYNRATMKELIIKVMGFDVAFFSNDKTNKVHDCLFNATKHLSIPRISCSCGIVL